MLGYLHVKNIALIDEVEVEFNQGLNIITGETGAGKSIIVGSINLALGAKASKDLIKKGCSFALIELIFITQSKEIKAFLLKNNFEVSDELTVSRKISESGRSIYKLNGEVANAKLIGQLASMLIDIHSQREHQSILVKKNHIRLLDKFLGDQISHQINSLSKKAHEYNELMKVFEKKPLDDSQRLREVSFLEHEINEIESANLIIGEDIKLEKQYRKLSNMNKIVEALSLVEQNITGQEQSAGASWLVSDALKAMKPIIGTDEFVSSLNDSLQQVEYLLSDFTRDLLGFVDTLNVDEGLLEETINRVDLINHLKNKYGSSIEDILEQLNEKKESLDDYINLEERLNETKIKLEIKKDEIINLCQEISEIRQQGACILSEKITDALKSLNFKNADFRIIISKNDDFTQKGYDDVEFFITMNQGEKLKPMKQVASGGEISRIMLAIKTIIADYDDINTLIFDEIDRGISGRTAQKVAENMANLSAKRQIICITHLPQIASMSDAHFVVNKTNSETNSSVTMSRLPEESVSSELARLLGGVTITKSVIDSALEMRNLANDYKNNIS